MISPRPKSQESKGLIGAWLPALLEPGLSRTSQPQATGAPRLRPSAGRWLSGPGQALPPLSLSSLICMTGIMTCPPPGSSDDGARETWPLSGGSRGLPGL